MRAMKVAVALLAMFEALAGASYAGTQPDTVSITKSLSFKTTHACRIGAFTDGPDFQVATIVCGGKPIGGVYLGSAPDFNRKGLENGTRVTDLGATKIAWAERRGVLVVLEAVVPAESLTGWIYDEKRRVEFSCEGGQNEAYAHLFFADNDDTDWSIAMEIVSSLARTTENVGELGADPNQP